MIKKASRASIEAVKKKVSFHRPWQKDEIDYLKELKHKEGLGPTQVIYLNRLDKFLDRHDSAIKSKYSEI